MCSNCSEKQRGQMISCDPPSDLDDNIDRY